jgi:hypothetical protein
VQSQLDLQSHHQVANNSCEWACVWDDMQLLKAAVKCWQSGQPTVTRTINPTESDICLIDPEEIKRVGRFCRACDDWLCNACATLVQRLQCLRTWNPTFSGRTKRASKVDLFEINNCAKFRLDRSSALDLVGGKFKSLRGKPFVTSIMC